MECLENKQSTLSEKNPRDTFQNKFKLFKKFDIYTKCGSFSFEGMFWIVQKRW